MSAILQIDNLCKQFKDFSLKNVSLILEKGYIMGFIGPNGAGKSTTIKLIMNLLRKDSGEIKVFGLDNQTQEKEIKNRIGFVYDENVFYEDLTVEEMKNVVAPFYSHWDEAALKKKLKEFDLPPNKKIKELSKGMKMKFSLAVALAHNAELLIMDEPTSGLDPLIRSELLEILTAEIQDENKAVFFSTHITSDLDRVADFVTLIDDGQVVFSKAKDDIVEKYALVKGSLELLDGDTRKYFVSIKENKFGFEAMALDRQTVRKAFGDSVILERPTIEDVMLYFTRRNQHA
jgi:ABC-2 type transport system ATP-binding protein